jgi:hypothetical protein
MAVICSSYCHLLRDAAARRGEAVAGRYYGALRAWLHGGAYGRHGAGKTTLMDVIAGCKTVGRVVGDIIVNGELKNPANFSRTTAY